MEVHLAGSGAVPHVQFCPEDFEPPIPEPCPALNFDETSLISSGTYQLHNHPDGNVRPPLYGLRLDGLETGVSSDIYTFDFDHADSNMKMSFDFPNRKIRIYGKAVGGLNEGNAYAESYPRLYTITFTYHLVHIDTNHIIAEYRAEDYGQIIDGETPPLIVNNLKPSLMDGSFFKIARNHRGVSTFSGWGWLDHSGRSHIAASDWLFTIGECINGDFSV